MSIKVRYADLICDREELTRFCSENLPEQPGPCRFEWLYLQNPSGEARTTIATESLTGQTVGVSSAFPRFFWQAGKRKRVWVLGDFCISRQFRSLGPATVLQRACMSSLPADDLWYDFPSEGMAAVYRRLGISVFARQTRYVSLLKPNLQTSNIAVMCAARSANLLNGWHLVLRHRLSARARSLECSIHTGSFGQEFTEFDRRVVTQYGVRALRTAEYLNWRYMQDPTANYYIITARNHSELAGYLVVKVHGTESTIVDVLAIEERPTILSLLAYLRNFLVKINVQRVHAMLLEECVLTRYFRMAGFLARESCPVMVAASSKPDSVVFSAPRQWLLLQGDRES